MAKKFAKTVYVYRDSEGTQDECLLVYESPEEAAELGAKRLVGVYELKETATIEASAKITVKRHN